MIKTMLSMQALLASQFGAEKPAKRKLVGQALRGWQQAKRKPAELFALSEEKLDVVSQALEYGCVGKSGGGCKVRNEVIWKVMDDVT
jgi:hypothetical protein